MTYEMFLVGMGCILGFNLGWFFCQVAFNKEILDSIEKTT